LSVDEKIAPLIPSPRIAGGVLVAAKVAGARPRLGDDLAAGDIVHAVNGAEIKDAAALRERLESLGNDSPLVIQVERAGILHLVILESD